MLRRIAMIVCFVLAAGLAVTAAGLLICPKCGYENPPAAVECVHCGAKLPHPADVPEAAPAAPAADEGGKLRFLDPKVVEAEVAAGRDVLDKGEIEVSRLFFKNAAALELLTDPQSPGTRAPQIADWIAKCDLAGTKVERICPACQGSGKMRMQVTSLKGETSFREIADMPCTTCGGSGKVHTAGTVDEQKFERGRALQRFATLEQARKYVAVGLAWVPADLQGRLSVKQTVTLKRAMAAPCPTCMGIGRINCKTCNGTAMVKCPEKNCKGGLVTIEADASGKIIGSSLRHTEKCRTCGGLGRVPCPTCRGVGSLVCPTCNGTGERPACAACGGEGWGVCRHCSGTGTVKGVPCPVCGGEGIVECAACKGDGRKR